MHGRLCQHGIASHRFWFREWCHILRRCEWGIFQCFQTECHVWTLEPVLHSPSFGHTYSTCNYIIQFYHSLINLEDALVILLLKLKRYACQGNALTANHNITNGWMKHVLYYIGILIHLFLQHCHVSHYHCIFTAVVLGIFCQWMRRRTIWNERSSTSFINCSISSY